MNRIAPRTEPSVANPPSSQPRQQFQLCHDVLRLILEVAARRDGRVAVTLLCLSHQIRAWIEPVLYENVSLKNADSVHQFLHPLASKTKSADFYSTTVKSMCLTRDVPETGIYHVLSVCRGITRLACWMPASNELNYDPKNISLITTLSLESLSINGNDVSSQSNPDFSRFPLLKFLDLWGDVDWENWSWTGLNSLEYLTYISFSAIGVEDPRINLEALKQLITRCQHLRVCLIRVYEETDLLSKLNKKLAELDIRIVAIRGSYHSRFSDWTRHSAGYDGDWEVAEKAVNGRTNISALSLNPGSSLTPIIHKPVNGHLSQAPLGVSESVEGVSYEGFGDSESTLLDRVRKFLVPSSWRKQ